MTIKKIKMEHTWFNVRKEELSYILLGSCQISLYLEQVPISESYSHFEVHLLLALLQEIVGFLLIEI